MSFSEKNLEDAIFKHLHTVEGTETLLHAGLNCNIFSLDIIKVFRQMRLGRYGIADIVLVMRDKDNLAITVYELKKDVVNSNTIIQCLRYASAIAHYLKIRGFSHHIRINCVVVGKRIDLHDWIPLTGIHNDLLLTCQTYSLIEDQLSFHNHPLQSKRGNGFNIPNKKQRGNEKVDNIMF